MINVKTAKSEITDVIETIEKWIPMFEQGNAPAVLADVMELLDSKQAEIELLKSQQARLLTFDEVKDHYSVPVSKLQIERYNDYAEDIKPLYFEFPMNDGWEVHWRGYDKVVAYLSKWEKDYGRTWRCWTDKPTDEQRNAVPWKDGEQK